MRHGSIVAIVLAAVIEISACSPVPVYHKTDVSGPERSADPLKPTEGVLVSVPRDGIYQGKPFPGSGHDVAQRTAQAFSGYAEHAGIADVRSQDRQQLLVAARDANAGYLVVPTIIHWEPRATEMTAIPSQVDIGITVIDVGTGHEIRSTVLEGRGSVKRFAQIEIEAMYSAVLDEHVRELYGGQSPTIKR